MTEDEIKWREQANCIGEDRSMFFPVQGDIQSLRDAKKICSECHVRLECLELGMTQTHGVWGGLSARERKILRSFRRRSQMIA